MHPKRVYVGLQFLWGFACCISATAYAPYLQSLGLSMSDIALINAVFWTVISVAELPTGMFADVIGRTRSMRIGTCLLAVASLSYAFAQGIWSALLPEFIGGMAIAFVSGADKAWLVDAMRAHDGPEAKLDRVLGNGQRYMSLGCLLGGLLGSWIGRFSFRAVYLCEGSISVIMAMYVWVFLHEERAKSLDDASCSLAWRDQLIAGKTKFLQSGQALAASKELRWAVLSTMVIALVLPLNLAWGAFFRHRFGAGGTSLLWAAFLIATGMGGEWIRRRGVRFGREVGPICLSLATAGFGMMLLSLERSLSMAIFAAVVHDVGIGGMRCLTDLFVQRRIESSWRATYGSLHALFSRLANGAILALWWLWSRGRGDDPRFVIQVWVTCGALLITCAGVLFLIRPKPSLVVVV